MTLSTVERYNTFYKNGKRNDIETLSIDRVLNKENSYRKCPPKASPGPHFDFGK